MKTRTEFLFLIIFSFLFCPLFIAKADNVSPVITTYPEAFVDFDNKCSITFGTLLNIENVSIKEYGVLYSSDNKNMTFNDNNIRKYVHKELLNNKGQFGIALRDPEGILGKSYYIRCYAIYEQNGIEYTVYSDESTFIKTEPTIITADISELASLVREASLGDEFIIKEGIYTDVCINLSGKGRYALPVKIKAETPGKVIFTGNTDITVSGEYIELSDFRFENTRSDTNIIKLNAAMGCRITECYFYDIFGETSTFVTCVSASNTSQKNRIDHNVFERTGGGLGVAVGYNEDSMNFDNRADHNYYKDVPAVSELFPGELNGFEQAGAGTSKTHDHIAPRMIVEDNLFENIIGDKSEVICIKSSENIIRYNTFLNCDLSGPDFRNGESCVFEGNFCINSKSGIRSYGANQVIKNNYFYNCQRGVELTTTNEGYLLQEGSQYRQSRNVTVEGNMFIYPTACGIKLGNGYNPLSGYIYLPEYTKIKDNVFVVDRAPAIIHSNSIFDDFSNNIVSVSGSGTVGTDSEGFETRKINLNFDGQIYIPEGMSIDKRGLKTPDDVGPTGGWWRELLKNPPDDITASVEHRSYKPNTYSPSKTEIVLIEGETYNLGNISGRGNYADMSLNVISDNMQYSVVDTTIASVSGLNLTGLKEGTTKLVANLKGKTAGITVKVIKSSVNENQSNIYTNDFENDASVINFSNSGVWKCFNGKLTNLGITTESLRMTVDNSLKLEGDFILNFELTAKPLNDADSGNVNGSVILGYKDNNFPEYYRINFEDAYTAESVISKNSNNVTDAVGIINVNITGNTTHNIEIRKIKNKLSVLIDGNLAAITDIPKNLSGRVGFASSKIAEIDNITVRRTDEPAEPSVQNINIDIERTDVAEVKLSFGNLDNDVIYKIYRNNIWLMDTNKTEFFDDSIKTGINYSYKILVYNKDTSLAGRGELSYSLPEEVDSDLFRITDCAVRTGIDGSYEQNTYILRNKGLSSNQRIYCDRVYTFGDVFPEKLEDAAYIMTRAEDVYNPYVQNEKITDFVKFSINKSATVYLLVFPNANNTNPVWLAENGWIQTGYKIGSYTKVFAKHYKASEISKATVEIGGFKGKLPMMYSIVIVPEETPEDFFAVTDCLVKTGADGSFESNIYPVLNSGLSNGCKIYNDRVYTYEGLPSELENSAYIMTSNNHISNAELQSGDTTEFIKFNINKSATVYILVAPNKNSISSSTHPWIKNWTLTGHTSGSFTKIYKRHYDVVPGNVVTVSTGGFKGKLPSMYTVVIKPD